MSPDRSSQAWSFGLCVLAATSFPFVLIGTFLLKMWQLLIGGSSPPSLPTDDRVPRTAIVTGGKMTKALCVCRQLKQSGCRVRSLSPLRAFRAHPHLLCISPD